MISVALDPTETTVGRYSTVVENNAFSFWKELWDGHGASALFGRRRIRITGF